MTAEAGDARGLANVAAALPNDGAQHTAAVERIAGKQIEDREQEISGADKEKECRAEIELQRCSDDHPAKGDQRKHKARRRPSHRDAKFSFRICRLCSHSRESAKRMQHDLFNVDAFGTPHQCVRQLMTEDRKKQRESCDDSKCPRNEIAGGRDPQRTKL